MKRDYKKRTAVNVEYYLNLEKRLTSNPPKLFKKQQLELFNVEAVTKKELV